MDQDHCFEHNLSFRLLSSLWGSAGHLVNTEISDLYPKSNLSWYNEDAHVDCLNFLAQVGTAQRTLQSLPVASHRVVLEVLAFST